VKVYLLKEEDLEALLTAIDRDPHYGYQGGGSVVLSEVERKAYVSAHSFFNHQVRRWLDTVKK
jgi:hypothetical protein